jgi:hypothetical protein
MRVWLFLNLFEERLLLIADDGGEIESRMAME